MTEYWQGSQARYQAELRHGWVVNQLILLGVDIYRADVNSHEEATLQTILMYRDALRDGVFQGQPLNPYSRQSIIGALERMGVNISTIFTVI